MSYSDKILEYLYEQSQTRDGLMSLISNDGKVYKIHDAIMGANSAYFQKNKHSEFTINTLDGKFLKTLIEFCYTGKGVYTFDDAKVMIDVAYEFNMPLLIERCWSLFEEYLNLDRAIDIFVLSNQFWNKTINKQALDIISSNFRSIPKKSLMTLDTNQILEIWQNRTIEDTEQNILQTLLDWLEFNNARRPEWLELNLPYDKYKQRYDSVYMLSIFDNGYVKVEKLNHAKQVLEIIHEFELVDDYDRRDDFVLFDYKIYIFRRFGDPESSTKSAMVYHLDTKQIEELPAMKNSETYATIAFGHHIYVLGSICQRFDTITKEWQEIPCPCSNPIMSLVHGELHAADGRNIYIFDPITIQWKRSNRSMINYMVVSRGEILLLINTQEIASHHLYSSNVIANGITFLLTESGYFGILANDELSFIEFRRPNEKRLLFRG